MHFSQTILLLGVCGLATALPQGNADPMTRLDVSVRSQLMKAYDDAYNAALQGPVDYHKGHEEKKDKRPKIDHTIKHQCDLQCGKTGAACNGACLADVLKLNVGDLVPCFARCGTASAACHNSCSQAEIALEEEAAKAQVVAAAEDSGTGVDGAAK